MSNRLLTLLTEIERAIVANDPSPDGGKWDTLRLVNFNRGLARLTLSVRNPAGVTSGRGVILLQQFTLADETQCVKANLSWNGVERSSVYSIYSTPQLDWRREANQVAAQWQDGCLTGEEEARVAPASSPDSADPLMSAAG